MINFPLYPEIGDTLFIVIVVGVVLFVPAIWAWTTFETWRMRRRRR